MDTKYIIAGIVGLITSAKFVDVKISGTFVAGMFVASQDANVIIAFIVGYILGVILVKRTSTSAAQTS